MFVIDLKGGCRKSTNLNAFEVTKSLDVNKFSPDTTFAPTISATASMSIGERCDVDNFWRKSIA